MTLRVRNCSRRSADLTKLVLADSPKRMSLHVPGCHGHVFAWDPPAFGVPVEVLEDLARKLETETVRLAIEHADQKVGRSGQSSPASESGGNRFPEPDLFEPLWTEMGSKADAAEEEEMAAVAADVAKAAAKAAKGKGKANARAEVEATATATVAATAATAATEEA